MTNETGWYADVDPDATEPCVWQPVLQIGGMGVSLSIWHTSRENCLAFIREEILGQGLHWTALS